MSQPENVHVGCRSVVKFCKAVDIERIDIVRALIEEYLLKAAALCDTKKKPERGIIFRLI